MPLSTRRPEHRRANTLILKPRRPPHDVQLHILRAAGNQVQRVPPIPLQLPMLRGQRHDQRPQSPIAQHRHDRPHLRRPIEPNRRQKRHPAALLQQPRRPRPQLRSGRRKTRSASSLLSISSPPTTVGSSPRAATPAEPMTRNTSGTTTGTANEDFTRTSSASASATRLTGSSTSCHHPTNSQRSSNHRDGLSTNSSACRSQTPASYLVALRKR